MNPLFQKIRLTSDTLEMNPLLEPENKARLRVYGTKPNGEEVQIPAEQVRFSAVTLLTNGEQDVASVSKEGVVTPLSGGYVRIDASYIGVGHGLSASLKLVIRPFWHEYHKTLTYKLFLAMEPWRPRSEEEEGTERDSSVYMDFAEAEDIIRRIDNMTVGMPKICYLVGWQKGGHDHLYPAFNEVNPRLKR